MGTYCPAYDSGKESDIVFLKKIYEQYLRGRVGSIEEPYWRVQAQFRCLRRFQPRIYQFKRAFGAALLFPILLARIAYSNIVRKSEHPVEIDGVKLGVLREYETPPSLSGYSIHDYDSGDVRLSTPDLIDIVRSLVRVKCYNIEVYYKCVREIAKIRGMLARFRPKFVLTFREYDYTSALQTDYLNKRAIRVCNVMHGDKAYGGPDGFFSFNTWFIWDSWYASLAADRFAKVEEYIVYRPARFIRSPREDNPAYEIGVLWPAFENSNHRELATAISSLSNKYKILVRCHPRFGKERLMKSFFEEGSVDFSDSKLHGIDSFFEQVLLVIGEPSTGLLEAYERGHQTIYLRTAYALSLEKYHPFLKRVVGTEIDSLEDTVGKQLQSGGKRIRSAQME